MSFFSKPEQKDEFNPELENKKLLTKIYRQYLILRKEKQYQDKDQSHLSTIDNSISEQISFLKKELEEIKKEMDEVKNYLKISAEGLKHSVKSEEYRRINDRLNSFAPEKRISKKEAERVIRGLVESANY